jgi:hypothetical protein
VRPERVNKRPNSMTDMMMMMMMMMMTMMTIMMMMMMNRLLPGVGWNL